MPQIFIGKQHFIFCYIQVVNLLGLTNAPSIVFYKREAIPRRRHAIFHKQIFGMVLA